MLANAHAPPPRPEAFSSDGQARSGQASRPSPLVESESKRKSAELSSSPVSDRMLSSDSIKVATDLSIMDEEDDMALDEFAVFDIDDWPFGKEDTPDQIVFTKDTVNSDRPVVKGATLEKLVERLTYEKYPDPDYTNAFLLTYRSFTSPSDLLDLLIQRFGVPKPQGASDEEMDQWVRLKQQPIQLRVFNALKSWVSTYWYDFLEDAELLKQLELFIINTMKGSGMEKAGNQLLKVIDKQKEGGEAKREVSFGQEAPPPVLPPSAHFTLMDLSPVEIARQITLIEYDLYCKIKPWECINQAWTKPTKNEKAPNIMEMIRRFNQVSRWVATSILQEQTPKDRAEVMSHFIDVAIECKELHNFNACMEIISGLQSSSIYRLHMTWPLIRKEKNKALNEIKALMTREGNFQAFRDHLHRVDPPSIPYLGVFLTDLTFLEDGNKDFVVGEGDTSLINFTKRHKISHVIREIRQYQQMPYCLQHIKFIGDYLLKAEYMEEDECYKLSVEMEPKASALKKVDSSVNSRRGTFRKKKKDVVKLKEEVERVGKTAEAEVEAVNWGPLVGADDYPFLDPDTKATILYDVDMSNMISGNASGAPVKAATLEKLVEKITHHSAPDMMMLNTLMITYPLFTTSSVMIELLGKRFDVPIPQDESLVAKHNQEVLIPVQLRVFNAVKIWVDKYFTIAGQDEEFVAKVTSLASKIANSSTMAGAGKSLERVLANLKEGIVPLVEHNSAGKMPAPILPGNVGNMELVLMDVDPEEAARQMTLLEQTMLFNMSPHELLREAHKGSDCEDKAPSLVQWLRLVEKRADMLRTYILLQEDTVSASKAVGYMITLAERALFMQNHSLFVNVVDVLRHPEISKLKVVWSGVPSKQKSIHSKHVGLLSKDFAKLRDKMDNLQPPAIPYSGLISAQIMDLDSTLPDRSPEGAHMINFGKFIQIAHVVSTFLHLSTRAYAFQAVPFIGELLGGLPVENDEVLAPHIQRHMTKHKAGRRKPTLGGVSSANLQDSIQLSPRHEGKRVSPQSGKHSLVNTQGSDGPMVTPTSSPLVTMDRADNSEAVKQSVLQMIKEDPEIKAAVLALIREDVEMMVRNMMEGGKEEVEVVEVEEEEIEIVST